MQTARPAARLSRVEGASTPTLDIKDESPNAGEAAKSTASPAKKVEDLMPVEGDAGVPPKDRTGLPATWRGSQRGGLLEILRIIHLPMLLLTSTSDVKSRRGSGSSLRSRRISREASQRHAVVSVKDALQAQPSRGMVEARPHHPWAQGTSDRPAAGTKQGWSVELITILAQDSKPSTNCSAQQVVQLERERRRVERAALGRLTRAETL